MTPEEMQGFWQMVRAVLREMTLSESEQFFELLYGEFCKHCGVDDPNCRCWDDS